MNAARFNDDLALWGLELCSAIKVQSRIVEFDRTGPEVGPSQFTIMSLAILTGAVAVYFALLTQAPDIIAAPCNSFLLLFVGLWMLPKYWRGIFALGLSLFTFSVFYGFEFGFPEGARLLIAASLVAILTSSIFAFFSSKHFDRIAGILCVFFWAVFCSGLIFLNWFPIMLYQP